MHAVQEDLVTVIDNNESTMNRFTQASVAAVLIRLRKIYFPAQSKEEIDRLVKKSIEDIKHRFKSMFAAKPSEFGSQASVEQVLKYIDQVAAAPLVKNLDLVDVYQDGEIKREAFLLREVLTLVYLALTDKSAYPFTDDRQSEQDVFDRMLTLYRRLKELVDSPVCHVGQRNEMTFCLNKSYPNVSIIEDINSFILGTFVEFIESRLRSLAPELQFLLLHKCLHPEEKISRGYFTFLQQQGAAAVAHLHTRFEENGLDPKDKELRDKSQVYLQEMELLPAPVGIHRHGAAMRQLMAVLYPLHSDIPNRESTGALLVARITTCQTFADFEARGLAQWIHYFELFQEVKKYQRLLFLGEEEQNLGLVTANLLTLFDKYFKDFPQVDNETIKTIEEAIVTYTKEHAKFRTNSNTNFIENFFSLWKTSDSKKRYHLYQRLLHVQEKIIFKDSILAQFLSKTEEEKKLHMTSYFVNRVLLHAFLVCPTQWTDTFYKCFSHVISFVQKTKTLQKESTDTNLATQLFSSCYPKTLLKQCSFLESFYNNPEHYHDKYDKELHDFFIPANLEYLNCKSLETFIALMKQLPKLSETEFCRVLTPARRLFPCQSNMPLLLLAISFLETDNQMSLLKEIGANSLVRTLGCSHNLSLLCVLLGENNKITFLKLLGTDAFEKLIADIDHLKSFLSDLSPDKRLAISQILGLELIRSRLVDFQSLTTFISLFPPDTKLSIVESLGQTFLSPLFHDNPGRCAHFLSTLPFDDRKKFLKLLNADTRRSIFNMDGLAIITRQLINSEKGLIDYLNTFIPINRRLEFLQKFAQCFTLVTSLKVVATICNALPEDNQVACLKLFNLALILKEGKDLCCLLENFNEQFRLTFVETLTENQFKQLIPDSSTLVTILAMIPESSWMALLKKLPLSVLLSFIESKLIADYPEKQAATLVHALGSLESLRSDIATCQKFISILIQLPKREWGIFLRAIDTATYTRIIRSFTDAITLLNLIDLRQRVDFIQLGCEPLKACLKYEFEFQALLSLFPQELHLACASMLRVPLPRTPIPLTEAAAPRTNRSLNSSQIACITAPLTAYSSRGSFWHNHNTEAKQLITLITQNNNIAIILQLITRELERLGGPSSSTTSGYAKALSEAEAIARSYSQLHNEESNASRSSPLSILLGREPDSGNGACNVRSNHASAFSPYKKK